MAAAAPVLTLVTAGIGLVGGLMAAGRQDEAAARQEAAAREAQSISQRNAALIEAEAMEEQRRVRYEGERKIADARARAAASGTVVGAGTQGLYVDEMERVLGEELDWLDYSMRERVKQEQHSGYYSALTGQAAADVTRAQATGTRADAVSSMFRGVSEFGGAYDWWQN